MTNKKIDLKKFFILNFLLAFLVVIILTQIVSAAALTGMKDTQTRLKKSTAANHTIQFTTPTGIAIGNTVTLTFGSDFSIASVVTADVTLEGAAVTSAVPVGQVLTITAGAGNVVAAAGTADIVITNNHITNPTTADSYTIAIAGTFGDTGSLAVAIANEDQVTISATVGSYLTFDVTDSTVTLKALGRSTLDPLLAGFDVDDPATPAQMIASTNNSSGYSITVSGGTLDDGAGHTITAIGGTAAASTPGTAQFGLNLKNNTTPDTGTEVSGGSGAAAGQYAIADSFAFATGNTVASCASASATTTFTMAYIANIPATQAAGSYTATHTYICTATF